MLSQLRIGCSEKNDHQEAARIFSVVDNSPNKESQLRLSQGDTRIILHWEGVIKTCQNLIFVILQLISSEGKYQLCLTIRREDRCGQSHQKLIEIGYWESHRFAQKLCFDNILLVPSPSPMIQL